MVFTATPAAHISNHLALVGGILRGMDTRMWQDCGVGGVIGAERIISACCISWSGIIDKRQQTETMMGWGKGEDEI